MSKRVDEGLSLKAKEKLADSYMVFSNTIFIGMLTWIVTPFLLIFNHWVSGNNTFELKPLIIGFWAAGVFACQWYGSRFRKAALDVYDRIEEDQKRRGTQ